LKKKLLGTQLQEDYQLIFDHKHLPSVQIRAMEPKPKQFWMAGAKKFLDSGAGAAAWAWNLGS